MLDLVRNPQDRFSRDAVHLPHANPISPTTGYKWTDGTAWNYKNWNTGEPNDLSGEDDCVEYNKNANWNDQNCYVAKPFVCKVQLGKRCKTKRIQHRCPMGTRKSKPEGSSFQWETRVGRVSHWNSGPKVWDIPVPLNTND